MSLEYRIGDVFERLAEIPDGSIDLIVTSPPFLALRSYLPADHPDKAREIGSEATPAAFIDTLLALTAEWGRVLAAHGSLCVELGDTFSGSGPGATTTDKLSKPDRLASKVENIRDKLGTGWPLAKSLTGIPTLYPWSLAYGRNLLTGEPSPAGQWRIRNVIVWARPNPPVGALGDKFRPATSYITVACRGAKRYFDLDAVRTESGAAHSPNSVSPITGSRGDDGKQFTTGNNPAGAPPHDWHADHHPEDGDWLWKLSTQPYAGSHYATFPLALPTRLIQAMCPLRVCSMCGRPSERITGDVTYTPSEHYTGNGRAKGRPGGWEITPAKIEDSVIRQAPTVGWTDCGCCVRQRGSKPGAMLTLDDCLGDHWRTGVVLDPFAGSGTTLEAAQAVGRHAIGIDLDSRNGDLARERVGMFLEVDGSTEPPPVTTPHNSTGNPRFRTGYADPVWRPGRQPRTNDYGT